VTIGEQSCIYWYLFNCYRLKIDFVTQFYVFPVKFCQTDILQCVLSWRFDDIFSCLDTIPTWRTDGRTDGKLDRHRTRLRIAPRGKHWYHSKTLFQIDTNLVYHLSRSMYLVWLHSSAHHKLQYKIMTEMCITFFWFLCGPPP